MTMSIPEIIEIEVATAPDVIEVVQEGPPGIPGSNGEDGVSITGAAIDGSGHLILSLSAGGPIDVGLVVGSDGNDGEDGEDGVSIVGAAVDGSGHLILTLSTGGTVDAGLVKGADGIDGTDGNDGNDGADGVSIVGATVDGAYHLILTLSNGSEIDAGYVRGASGSGSGDVTGPASSAAGNFASFADATGKSIADSGKGPSDFATAAQGSKADTALQSVVEGANVSVDNTDPLNPVISAAGDMVKAVYDTDDDGKVDAAAAADSAPWGGITGKPTTLAGYGITDAATSAQGGKADTAVQPGDLGSAAALDAGTAAGQVPVLDGDGLLPTSVLPPLAITDTHQVASEPAMLALTAQKGDIAIRTDISRTFVLAADDASILGNWKEIQTPTDLVLSVAGLTGAISASALRAALSLVVGTDVQAYDADLAALAALTPGDDDFLQRKSGGWTNRTPAQVKTDLGLDASGVDFQEFTSSGTWNKPAGCTMVYVECVGGGGSGGAGGCAATSTLVYGGSGGGGGMQMSRLLPAALLASSVSVVVGAGGAQVSGRNTAGTGNNGNGGGTSAFGDHVAAGGGKKGNGGGTGIPAGGNGGQHPKTGNSAPSAFGVNWIGGAGGSASGQDGFPGVVAGGGGSPSSSVGNGGGAALGGAGGGHGGSITAANGAYGASHGGLRDDDTLTGGGGSPGSNHATAPSAGGAGTAPGMGGGGGGCAFTSGNAAPGGAGNEGGGGGGGGASRTGGTSGAGGAGGNGIVRVWAW